MKVGIYETTRFMHETLKVRTVIKTLSFSYSTPVAATAAASLTEGVG